jgi:uncharacterized protein YvpB
MSWNAPRRRSPALVIRDTPRRRSPPFGIWLLLGLLLAAGLLALASGWVAWQKASQAQALQAELAALQGERQAVEAQMLSLQSTATALGSRLATLEANDPAQQLATIQAAMEEASDPQQLDDLGASLAEIQTKVDVFQDTLDQLAARLENLESANMAAEGPLPSEARLDVPRQRQSHNLSCESSAASMAAQYHGVNLSEAQVLAALPRNDNPHLGFRGNVDGPTGGIEDYGVYAGPILAILNSRGLRARAVEGGLEGIRAAIARGNPVLAWVTYNCGTSTPVETTIDGKAVTLVPWQHVVVVTGYNADGVWANDPWDGQEDFYSNADLQQAMSYFGNMAIEVAAPQ